MAGLVLKLLSTRRTEVVHREPLDLFFTRGLGFPERFGSCIETDKIEVYFDQTEQGQVSTRIKVGANGSWEDVPTEIAWCFSKDDKKDVPEYCYLGLQKINALHKELAEMRISKGLPPDKEGQPEDAQNGPSVQEHPCEGKSRRSVIGVTRWGVYRIRTKQQRYERFLVRERY